MLSITRPAQWPRWVRYAVTTFAVVMLLAATGLVGYRLLSPAETAVPASQIYPERPGATATRYGELTSAPLIVDGRLRVYADARRVWSDASVTAPTETTPYWSYRRWPAEVVGVVAIEGSFEGVGLVITRFSDGMVVALNPLTGLVAWQDRVKVGDQDRYTGRRTGAQTVYEPAGLFTTRDSRSGGEILIVAGGDDVIGYDPWTGMRRWSHTFTENPGCHDTDWTGETTYIVKDSCSAPAVLRVFDAATGNRLGQWHPPGASAGPAEAANWFAEPASCALGHSGCALVKAAAVPEVITFEQKAEGKPGVAPSYWRLNYDGSLSPEPHALADRVFLLKETLVQEDVIQPVLQARERSNGAEVWRGKEPVLRLVAVDKDKRGVYAITRDFHLIVLHPTTGVELSRTNLRKRASEDWQPGYVHVAGRFVAVERLTGGVPWEPDDRYYAGPTPVVLAGV
jgi:outer membrane protein assembly factor BamB